MHRAEGTDPFFISPALDKLDCLPVSLGALMINDIIQVDSPTSGQKVRLHLDIDPSGITVAREDKHKLQVDVNQSVYEIDQRFTTKSHLVFVEPVQELRFAKTAQTVASRSQNTDCLPFTPPIDQTGWTVDGEAAAITDVRYLQRFASILGSFGLAKQYKQSGGKYQLSQLMDE